MLLGVDDDGTISVRVGETIHRLWHHQPARLAELDRDRVRVACPTLILLLPAVGFQLSRYRDQVDTGNFRFWAILGYLTALCATGLYLIRGDWKEALR